MALPALWMAAIVYACELTILSIGFTLTYLTAKIPNFAYGTMSGIGIYSVYMASRIFKVSPYIGFPVGTLLGGVFSVLVYILIVKVLASMGGGAIVLTIATLAIQIFLQAALYIYAYWVRSIWKLYTIGFLLKTRDFVFLETPGILYVSLITSVVVIIGLHYMLNKTKIGIAMRATTESIELASILGINTDRIQLYSWFLTGCLAGLAGSMVPMWFMSSPLTASGMQTSVMAGSLIGGFTNMYGAIIGGFSIGLLEIVLTYYLQMIFGAWVGEYRPIIPMAVLVIILLIEPQGLQGLYHRFMATKTGESILKSLGRGE